MASVPVIDFSVYSLTKDEIPTDDQLQEIVSEIGDAFQQHRCFWIKNSGVDIDSIRDLFQKCEGFFSLPHDTKVEYIGKNVTFPTGYFPETTASDYPRSDSEVVGRQAFHYCPLQDNKKWPEEDLVPGLISSFDKYWNQATSLTMRIAECLSLTLGMQRQDLVNSCFRNARDRKWEENWSTIRVNMYDPVHEKTEDSDRTIRLHSHCDWTIFTLLYPTCDGLMTQKEDDSWEHVGYKEDAILVQTGFVLETLTGGKIKPNRHRVDVPSSPTEREKTRFSAAYFAYGDNDVPLTTFEKLNDKSCKTKKIGESLVQLLSTFAKSGNADHETQ